MSSNFVHSNRKNENFTISDIKNLPLKLAGKNPISKIELAILINSYGRNESAYYYDDNYEEFMIHKTNEYLPKDLSKLDVSKITNFDAIFKYSNFNGDISKWDVSNATSMKDMFYKSKFNQDISNWDVSKVVSMKDMFNFSEFNQDISNWNVSNVTDMSFMFNGSKFDGNIFKWDIKESTHTKYMINNFNFYSKWGLINIPLKLKVNDYIQNWFENKKIELNINENKKTLSLFLKENNIDINSSEGIKLVEIYNEVQKKLENKKNDSNLLKLENQIINLAINDFENI